MPLLDTDHMSLIERGGIESSRILKRLRAVPPDDVATTIISYEEQTRGWLSRVAQAATPERKIRAYGELKRQLRNYCDIAVIEYDMKAAEAYERLRKMRLGMGTKDLQIAAIALANDAVLLTRNLSDFSRVPDLRIEDWSV